MTAAGVCTTASCVRAMSGVPVDLYEGPGEYCPDCGERLRGISSQGEADTSTSDSSNAARFDRGDFVRTDDPIRYESHETTVVSHVAVETVVNEEPVDPVRSEKHVDQVITRRIDPTFVERPRIDPANRFDRDENDERSSVFGRVPQPTQRLLLLSGFGLVLFATSVLGGASLLPGLGVRVCTSSMTDRIATNLTHAYTAQHRNWPYHASVERAGTDACDVRFQTSTSGRPDGVIARDGVVVIVNPRNSVAALTGAQVRDIFSGKITDWSQVGGTRGPIAAVVPRSDSDEVRVLDEKIMSGNRIASRVSVVDSADRVVERIVGTNGTGAIGIVPLSAAGNAKVVPFAHATAPNPASIAAERYPLFVRVIAGSDFRSPTGLAAGILEYARSTATRPTTVHAALGASSR